MIDRRAMVILFLTLFLVMLSFGIIIPNLVYYAEDLHATKPQVGWLMAIYSLCQFVFSPLWGAFSDRFGRRPTILIGLAGNGIGLWMFGTADTVGMLFAARAISGTLTAAALPACMAYVADVTDERGRGKGMGLMGAAMGLGFILGPPVGGIVGQLGHNTPFLLAAVITGLTLIFAVLFLKESLPPEAAARTRPKYILPLRALAGPLSPFYILSFFAALTMSGLETTFPFLVNENLGVGVAALGWMLGIMGVAVAAFQGGLLGRLINRFGEEAILLAGLLVNAAGFFFIASASSVGSMTFYLTVTGVGNLILRPTNSSLISKRTTEGQGAAIGSMNSMDSLGRVVGPFLAGYLYTANPALPYYFGALALSLTFVGLSVSRRSKPAGDGPSGS